MIMNNNLRKLNIYAQEQLNNSYRNISEFIGITGRISNDFGKL